MSLSGRRAGGIQGILRMADANLNRAGEGLRVAEDVLRFVFSSKGLSGEARFLRHAFSRLGGSFSMRGKLLGARDSRRDVGASRWREGMGRKDARDLLSANLRRTQESARVLEEAARLLGRERAIRSLQGLRYRLYDLEKRAAARLAGRTRR